MLGSSAIPGGARHFELKAAAPSLQRAAGTNTSAGFHMPDHGAPQCPEEEVCVRAWYCAVLHMAWRGSNSKVSTYQDCLLRAVAQHLRHNNAGKST